MQTVLVMRTGSSLCLNERVNKSSPLGEGRDTLGIIHYLLDTNRRVVVYGCTSGVLDHPNIRVVNPAVSKLDENTPKDDTDAVYDAGVEALIEACEGNVPNFVLNPVGYAASMTYNSNPFGVSTQMCSVKYACPALYAMEKLKLKRIVLCTDIRNYPREGEFRFWPYTIPAAVLSQENFEYDTTLRDVTYHVTARYAGLENFFSYGAEVISPTQNTKLYDVGVFSHSHLKDGRINKGRDDAWSLMFDALTYVHGHGWELFSKADDPKILGLLKDYRDMELKLRQTLCGPMISMRPSFTSCKLRLYAINGSLPTPFGNGHRRTYDGTGRYVPINADIRVLNADDIQAVVRRCKTEPNWRDDWVLKIQQMTTPNYGVLENCMLDIQSADINSREWIETYGSYQVIG